MKKHITIHIRIEDNLHQKIEKSCRQIKMSKSDFIRGILEEKCDQILMGKSSDYHTRLLEEILSRTAFNQARIHEELEQDNQGNTRDHRFRLYGKEVLERVKKG